MFSDPQSLAFTDNRIIAAPGNLSLPAVSRADRTSKYELEVIQSGIIQTVDLTISHQINKRKRSVVRIDLTGVAANFTTGTGNIPSSASVYLVVDRPLNNQDDFDDLGYQDVITALVTWLSASSYANTVKFLGGES